VFSQSPDYIGWAPVPPGFSVGVSIGRRDFDTNNFVFVASRDFDRPHIRTYAVPRASAPVIFNHTTIVNNIRVENNIVVNHGPDVAAVERASGRTIRPTQIEQVSRIAPTDHVTRNEIRIDPARERHGFRAAEPNMEAQLQRPPQPQQQPHYPAQNNREDRPPQPYQRHEAVQPQAPQTPQPQTPQPQQPQQARPPHHQDQPQVPHAQPPQPPPRPERQPQPHQQQQPPQHQQQTKQQPQQQHQQQPKPKPQPEHKDGEKHDAESDAAQNK
jgi:hypothetical protein